MPSKLGIVSLKSQQTKEPGSQVESSSKTKEYILTFFLTVTGGFLTVFLMHPISKTGWYLITLYFINDRLII